MITTPVTIDPFAAARMLKSMAEYNLSASATHALCVIREAGADALTMSTTAKALGLSTAALTGLADTLEALGFITRRPARVDRRVIWLELTEQGRAALTDILTIA